MEGTRDVPAAAQGRRWRRRRGGDGDGSGGGESDRSSGGGGGGVELSLRLRMGDSSSAPPAAAAAMVVAEEEHQAAAARRNMTIFYNGRVCAVDVTEVQARAIISMANDEMISAAADHHRQQCHQRDRHLQDSGSSSSSSSSVLVRCARDAHAHVRPPASGSSRQGFAAVAAAPVIDQAASGLSMKRSLQRFLQKRKARTAGAVAPPYFGGL